METSSYKMENWNFQKLAGSESDNIGRLMNVTSWKVQQLVIKLVKDITNLDLKEVKAIVDGTPKAIKEKVSKAEAGDIKNKLEEASAMISINS